MKTKKINRLMFVTLLVLAFGLMAFTPAGQGVPPIQTPNGDQVVLGDNYTLDEGETLNGDLFVMGGNADLREDSTVSGDIVVMGGNLDANGRIEGDVTAIGGLITLGESAVVEGDVNVLSANLLRDEGAEIHGQVNTNLRFPFFYTAPAVIPSLPGNLPVRPEAPIPSAVDMGLNFIGGFLWWLGRSFVWAFLALLALLFWPRPVARIADAAMTSPVPAGGLGLLTAIVAPLVLGLVALTICGIPIALIGLLALAVAWALGIIALGLETGARLERLVNQDWAPPVQAAIGTLVLTMVVNGIGAIVPCVGWMVPFVVGMVGLGAAVLTRLGSQAYPLAGAVIVGAPAAAAPYTPPASGTTYADDVFDTGDDDLPPPL